MCQLVYAVYLFWNEESSYESSQFREANVRALSRRAAAGHRAHHLHKPAPQTAPGLALEI